MTFVLIISKELKHRHASDLYTEFSTNALFSPH